jgi:inner membrane protein involved in colicin E2 resistance
MTRLFAIVCIWLGCAVAWMFLGSTLLWRSNEVSGPLRGEVHGLWGPPGRQLPPAGTYQVTEKSKETVTTTPEQGAAVKQVVEREKLTAVPLTLDRSDIDAAFHLEHRKKGLLWFPTYQVDFHADYSFQNPTDQPQLGTLSFPLQGDASQASVSFDGFKVVDERGKPVDFRIEGGAAHWTDQFAPRARHRYAVAYRTRGTASWQYAMTAGTGRVRNLELRMKTDFVNVNFPPGTTSPTEHSAAAQGWQGKWRFESLISGAPIGIEMPQLLNPGPLASKVTFFAPLSLLFFFFVVAILASVNRRELHPMHYLLLGCAFFAFHLLFSYLVDHLEIAPSFLIASLVSLALVTTYARLFVGWRFALREMGISQLIYLVLFSYTFFWEGFTGLAITIGAILTLFVVMQITGRVHWSDVFRRRPEVGLTVPTAAAS